MCMFCDHTSKSTELYSHNNESNNNDNHINNNINNDNVTSLLLINRSRVHFIFSEQAEWPSPNRIFVAIIHILQHNMSWKCYCRGLFYLQRNGRNIKILLS